MDQLVAQKRKKSASAKSSKKKKYTGASPAKISPEFVDSDSDLDNPSASNRENVELNGTVEPSLFINASDHSAGQIGNHMVFLERPDASAASRSSQAASSNRQQPVLFQPTEIGLSFLKRISAATGTSPVNEWMSHEKLKALEALGEIKVRRGKFSSVEEELLTQIVRTWLEERNLGPEDLVPYLNRRLAPGSLAPHKRKEFWRYIASHFPDRTMSSLYLRINRRFHPSNQESGWTKAELEHLRVLVAQFGTNWQEIGQMLGRYPENCRTRWRSIKHLYAPSSSSLNQTAAASNEGEEEVDEAADDDAEEQPTNQADAATSGDVKSKRRMNREEQGQILSVMLDRMHRNYALPAVAEEEEESNSMTLNGKVIHMDDLRLALQTTTAYPWTEIREQLIRLHPHLSPRNADFLRLHWKLVMEPNLLLICNDDSLGPWISYDRLLEQVRQGKDRQFTVATSLAMLRRIKELYPEAFIQRDIVWTEVHKSPEFVGKSYRACKRVFDILLRTYIPDNSPLYVHVVGVKSLGTFPPITDAIDYLSALLSVKPADELVAGSRKRKK